MKAMHSSAEIWVQLLEAMPEPALQPAPQPATEPASGEIAARWFLRSSDAQELLHHGSLDELTEFVAGIRGARQDNLKAVLLLSGDEVVTRTLPLDVSERKHLGRLLPFMIEPELAVDLSQMHIVSGQIVADSKVKPDGSRSGERVWLAYTHRQTLLSRIDTLEKMGLEINRIYAIPALLQGTSTDWILLIDEGVCHLNAGNTLCASAEPEWMAALVSRAIESAAEFSGVKRLRIVADHKSRLEVSNIISVCESAGIEIRQHSCRQPWELFSATGESLINLRQGDLAAPLRLGKLRRKLALPTAAAALAVAVVMVSSLAETWFNQSRFRALEAQIEQRYRDVMPEGVLVDAVSQLSAQINQLRGAQTGPGVVAMLNSMTEPFAAVPELRLHRLVYNNSTGAEIQMSITAPSTAAILELSENLNASGWSAQAQNISRTGDQQQANLLIRGNTQ